MTLMQKALTPQLSDAYLAAGYERTGGFAVPAQTVTWASTAADLVRAHGLTYPGSPYGPDSPHVDVLRFDATAQLRFEDAVGGPDRRTRERTGGPFLDRPPFTGTGFVGVPDHVVPLYWFVHSRVPAGAQLVRVGADGSSVLLATYVDVAHGWVTEDRAVAFGLLPLHVGPLARWNGNVHPADVLGDRVVLAAAEPLDGFERTAAGRFRRDVPRGDVEELFELYVEARWNGLDVRVVDEFTDRGRPLVRVCATTHDADLAEGLRMDKVEAALYEATVAPGALTDVVTSQLVPAGWASR
ncbi:hypothetical protein J1G43_02770 [Cellulomonas sp. zg-ZUI22]|nr:hypothetical protein [Cellulomonas sp. zg-ZUI22]